MTQLTKEEFERTLDTKHAAQTKELKAYADEQTEKLARVVNAAFQAHQEQYLEEKFEQLIHAQDVWVELRSLAQRVEQLEKRKS
jgi:hypothetical protein